MDDLEILEKQCNLYMSTCWSVFKAAKERVPGDRFVGNLGTQLYKNKKLSYKQLLSLYDIIDKDIIK